VLGLIRRIFRIRVTSTRRSQPKPSAPSYRRKKPSTYTQVRREVRVETTAVVETYPSTITGKCHVIDGDTIRIGKVNLRLAGIDAPELNHPWGNKAKWELIGICKGKSITAKLNPEISYDRPVATCFLPDGTDLSAEMVRRGLALDWPKFSGGKYGHLEPDGARKKHWKAAARQRGHMAVFHK